MSPAVKQSIDNHVKYGTPTGSFTQAVLENNLTEAFALADEYHRVNLFSVVMYCYNEIPSPCWGSPEKVRAWVEARREEQCNEPT